MGTKVGGTLWPPFSGCRYGAWPPISCFGDGTSLLTGTAGAIGSFPFVSRLGSKDGRFLYIQRSTTKRIHAARTRANMKALESRTNPMPVVVVVVELGVRTGSIGRDGGGIEKHKGTNRRNGL